MKLSPQRYFENVPAVIDMTIRSELYHTNEFNFAVAVILSAQATDKKVNEVTPELFRVAPTPQKMLALGIDGLKNHIRVISFFNNKAKNIIACARRVLTEFGGEVPRSLEELTSLAGVGRKTANVIRGNIYHEPSIVVDTHVKRISKKLGFTKEEDPEKIEFDLMGILPEDHWILYNIHIITLGRTICTARSPKCTECFLADVCKAGMKS